MGYGDIIVCAECGEKVSRQKWNRHLDGRCSASRYETRRSPISGKYSKKLVRSR